MRNNAKVSIIKWEANMGDDKRWAGIGISAFFVTGIINGITGANALQTVGVFVVILFILWVATEEKKDKQDK